MAKQVVKRYEKQVPGHHVQIDVKFLSFPVQIKRYQFTAVDDATRFRVLKIYRRHTQANAIKFVDYVRTQFPFRIRTIQTDMTCPHEWWQRISLCWNHKGSIPRRLISSPLPEPEGLRRRRYMRPILDPPLPNLRAVIVSVHPP